MSKAGQQLNALVNKVRAELLIDRDDAGMGQTLLLVDLALLSRVLRSHERRIAKLEATVARLEKQRP